MKILYLSDNPLLLGFKDMYCVHIHNRNYSLLHFILSAVCQSCTVFSVVLQEYIDFMASSICHVTVMHKMNIPKITGILMGGGTSHKAVHFSIPPHFSYHIVCEMG